MAIINGDTTDANFFVRVTNGSAAYGVLTTTGGVIDVSLMTWKGAYRTIASSYDLSTASGNQSIAHTLSYTPKIVRIKGVISDNANGTSSQFTCWAETTYDGTTQASTYLYQNGGDGGATAFSSEHGNSFRLMTSKTGGAYQTGTVTVTSTNVVIAWTKTGSPTGTANLKVDVFA